MSIRSSLCAHFAAFSDYLSPDLRPWHRHASPLEWRSYIRVPVVPLHASVLNTTLNSGKLMDVHVAADCGQDANAHEKEEKEMDVPLDETLGVAHSDGWVERLVQARIALLAVQEAGQRLAADVPFARLPVRFDSIRFQEHDAQRVTNNN